MAVIGTSCSSAALGVADQILSEEGIALISPSNTGPDLTDPATHQEFYLRTAHNDLLQGAAVAQFAFEDQGSRARRPSTMGARTRMVSSRPSPTPSPRQAARSSPGGRPGG